MEGATELRPHGSGVAEDAGEAAGDVDFAVCGGGGVAVEDAEGAGLEEGCVEVVVLSEGVGGGGLDAFVGGGGVAG